MRTILLFGQGGCYNRGCEAIVRCTVALLRQRLGDIKIILSSYDHVGDRPLRDGLVDEVIPAFAPRWTPLWALGRVAALRSYRRGLEWWVAPVRSAIREADLALSIGGDNYCYRATPEYYILVDRIAKEHGVPVVLWGASVDLTTASDATCEDLRAIDLITARESLTVQQLSDRGIIDNVRLVADPAFLLPAEPVETSAFWPEGEGVLGFNVSPLLHLYRAEQDGDRLVFSLICALRDVIDRLGYGVLLVPHVTGNIPPQWRWNDDAVILARVQSEVQRPRRITLMPSSLDVAQTKYVIACCRLFVGARTHSVIAALSSGVPTLTIGYSIKARGIARDVLADDSSVIDVNGLDEQTMLRGIRALAAGEQRMRARLAEIMPKITHAARSGVEHAAALLGEKPAEPTTPSDRDLAPENKFR